MASSQDQMNTTPDTTTPPCSPDPYASSEEVDSDDGSVVRVESDSDSGSDDEELPDVPVGGSPAPAAAAAPALTMEQQMEQLKQQLAAAEAERDSLLRAGAAGKLAKPRVRSEESKARAREAARARRAAKAALKAAGVAKHTAIFDKLIERVRAAQGGRPGVLGTFNPDARSVVGNWNLPVLERYAQAILRGICRRRLVLQQIAARRGTAPDTHRVLLNPAQATKHPNLNIFVAAVDGLGGLKTVDDFVKFTSNLTYETSDGPTHRVAFNAASKATPAATPAAAAAAAAAVAV